jgi:hypothetical protein
MLRFLGLLLLSSFVIRALASGLFTVDVPGTAGLVQSTGGYLFNGQQQQQTEPGVQRVPYNPNTGRVNPRQPQAATPPNGNRYTF